MMKKIIQFILAVLIALPAVGQTVTLNGETEAVPGPANVSVTFDNIGQDVHAISLYIEYDEDLLTYTGSTYILFEGAYIGINANNGLLKAIWDNLGGANLDGKSFELQFEYYGGFETDLLFDVHEPLHEITDEGGTAINVDYINGTISPKLTDPDVELTLENVAAPQQPGSTVSIPLDIDYTKDPHTAELYIGYDNNLEFENASSNVVPFIVNYSDGVIKLTWTDYVNKLPDGTAIILNFTYLGMGPAQVYFLPGSVVGDENSNLLHTKFEAGTITQDSNHDANIQIAKVTTVGATVTDTFYGSEIVYKHETVDVSITNGITGVAAITLKISYDTEKLEYTGFDQHQLIPWMLTHNDTNGVLTFSKPIDDPGYQIDAGTLFTLKFDYKVVPVAGELGQADIVFEGGSFLQKPDMSYFNIGFEDGWISMGYMLDLKVFLEGPYKVASGKMETDPLYSNAIPTTQPYNMVPWNFSEPVTVSSIPSGVADWILVELRDADAPANAVPNTQQWIGALFLMEDGSVVDLDGESKPVVNIVPEDDLFVIIHHRNHIGIMSAVGMNISGGTMSYDFTIAEDQAFDGGIVASPLQKELNTGTYGMFTGDYNKDGTINLNDVIAINGQRLITPPLQGYNQGDLFFNGAILLPDVLKANSNRLLNIFSRIP